MQNSLTISTHLTDNGVLFDVYDKNFNKITIDYYDYLNSKVVASEYVNYETNTLKPTADGKLEVKHRMRRKFVDKDDFDLIDLHPDYRLSETSRQIPFLKLIEEVKIYQLLEDLKIYQHQNTIIITSLVQGYIPQILDKQMYEVIK